MPNYPDTAIPAYPGSPADLAQRQRAAAGNTWQRGLMRGADTLWTEFRRADPMVDMPYSQLAAVPGAVKNAVQAAVPVVSSLARKAVPFVPAAASAYAARAAFADPASAAPAPPAPTGMRSTIRSTMGLRR